MSQAQTNPWKIATVVVASSIFAALASGVVVAKVQNARNRAAGETQVMGEAPAAEQEWEAQQTAAPATAPVVEQAAAPAASASTENCERYLDHTHTDGGRVVKNGLIGGALGAGLGAAGGAIGGSAGKGAGIGALAGAAVGSGYTLHDEHRKKEDARLAYQACLARNGY